jgi:hypothetical protein
VRALPCKAPCPAVATEDYARANCLAIRGLDLQEGPALRSRVDKARKRIRSRFEAGSPSGTAENRRVRDQPRSV